MSENGPTDSSMNPQRLDESFRSQRPSLIAMVRAGGRTYEEAEDLVHEVYAETLERLPGIGFVRSMPAWITSLVRKRSIDLWRRKQTAAASGHIDVAEQTIREIVSGVGLDPLDEFVREELTDALNDAIAVLPKEQRQVVEYQVFGGLTFAEISRKTGVGIDTLTARKRYALRNLARALRHWIDE